MTIWTLEYSESKQSIEEEFDNLLKRIIDPSEINYSSLLEKLVEVNQKLESTIETDWKVVIESSQYKDFCNQAKDVLQTNSAYVYRVMKTTLDQHMTAVEITENKGVYKYLLATINIRE